MARRWCAAAFVFLSCCALCVGLQIQGRSTLADAEEFPWPLVFLHIPKSGGDFATTVLHAVNPEIGENAFCREPEDCKTWLGSYGHRVARFGGGHLPLSGDDVEALGAQATRHTVAFFREPSARMLSGFAHNRHDCAWLRDRTAPHCDENDLRRAEGSGCRALWGANKTELEEYAWCVGSCQMNMLGGVACPNKETQVRLALEPGTVEEIAAKVDELAFVGLTERFAQAVCLWHLRFGGQCLPVELKNRRLGKYEDGRNGNKENFGGNETLSGAWAQLEEAPLSKSRPGSLSRTVRDHLERDQAVYDAAVRRFDAEVRKYDASPERCARVCPQ